MPAQISVRQILSPLEFLLSRSCCVCVKFWQPSGSSILARGPALLAFTAAMFLTAALAGAQAAEPLNIVIAVGPNKEAMAQFRDYLEKHYQVEITFVESDLEGIVALKTADVLLCNLRRTKPSDDQLALIKKYFADGGSVVGLRRAHHAFQNWLEADREVFGVKYGGHGGGGKNAALFIPEDQKTNPLVVGLNPFMCGGGLYDHTELDPKATVLLKSEAGDKQWPQMWTIVKDNGQRVFYTRYDPADVMQDEGVRSMVVRALGWATETDMEKLKVK